uniref:RING-type domain-containing protein n=1 Tax=Glossina brevipalpis TaxID=37001 RepID=A0A1A9X1B0_9MUSC
MTNIRNVISNEPNEMEGEQVNQTLRREQTTIDIDMDTNGNQRQHSDRNSNFTTINSEHESGRRMVDIDNETVVGVRRNSNSQGNLLSLINEARSHLERQVTLGDGTAESPPQQHRRFMHSTSDSSFTSSNAANSTNRSRYARSWRMNLNNVLSFSSASSAEALRSLISHSGNFRYSSLRNDDNSGSDTAQSLINEVHPGRRQQQPSNDRIPSSSSSPMSFRVNINMNSRLPMIVRQNLRSLGRTDTPAANSSTDLTLDLPDEQQFRNMAAATNGDINRPNQQMRPDSTDNQASINNVESPRTVEIDSSGPDDINNEIPELVLKLVSAFVRYLPFICIILMKFIHDHLLGIMDLIFLQAVMYQINNSLRQQVAKLSQKSYSIVLRDYIIIICVIMYRFIIASSKPEPFGLLIPPPTESLTVDVYSADKAVPTSPSAQEFTSNFALKVFVKAPINASPTPSHESTGNKLTITKYTSLEMLLYYVALNDLILKLLTQLIKITITTTPTKLLRHKVRARLYVLIEYISQFYRALAPITQWLKFLHESYTGLEVISGMLFSSFYIGAKIFELVERSKLLKRALLSFIRNNDSERKPTNDELDAAGNVCPICHDAYNSPIVLQCGHIFCDDCVGTWFKREQTCPMCRTKVNDDPTYQDGSTTFFYQIF